MIWCKFLRKSFEDLYGESSVIYSLITGEKFTENHIKIAGERINNLKKLFNIKNGWSRIDDNLPNRLLESNNKKNQIISKNFLDSMINNYYHFREWDKNGNIPNNKLKSLNIS